MLRRLKNLNTLLKGILSNMQCLNTDVALDALHVGFLEPDPQKNTIFHGHAIK